MVLDMTIQGKAAWAETRGGLLGKKISRGYVIAGDSSDFSFYGPSPDVQLHNAS